MWVRNFVYKGITHYYTSVSFFYLINAGIRNKMLNTCHYSVLDTIISTSISLFLSSILITMIIHAELICGYSGGVLLQWWKSPNWQVSGWFPQKEQGRIWYDLISTSTSLKWDLWHALPALLALICTSCFWAP